MKIIQLTIGRLRFFAAVVFLHFSLFTIHYSLACAFCFPFPVKSAADHLFENEHVVFARLNPDDQFSYAITRQLKGYAETEQLDYFADTSTRRRLQANPDTVVVFVRGKDADDWRSLGVADKKYQQVIERIVAQQHIWRGKDGEQLRLRLFVELFDHEERAIFELAYLEIARAPYSTIKKIGRVIPKARIRSLLTRREYLEWRPLAILLLAQDPNHEDRQLLERKFETCKKFLNKRELGACLTAYIELHGVAAIDEIDAVWLKSKDRSAEEVKLVITALTIQQRCGNTELREHIASCLKTEKENSPRVTK